MRIPDVINGLQVSAIGDRAFHESDMTSVTIPEGVVSIGSSAFEGCHSLTNVILPESLNTIGFAAFSGCGVSTIRISKNVTNIDEVAFSGCPSLLRFDVDEKNSIYASKDGLLLDKREGALIKCPGGRSGNCSVPEGVSSIGDLAFTECEGPTSVTLPDSVTNILWHAFMGCGGLTKVSIGAGVTNIGYGDGWLPFHGCGNLAAITVSPLNRAYSSPDGVLVDKREAALIKYPEGKAGSYKIPDGVRT